MSEMQSNRRRQAMQDLSLDHAEAKQQMEQAMRKEEQRQLKKQQRRKEIEQSSSYKASKNIAKWMDKFYLDPIIGFFAPGFGDALTSFFVFPFIYLAAFKVRSLPLTLAVIFNVLQDIAIGLIPFCIGDILDIFHRSYVKNFELIVGFVEDDKDVIHEVNRKAVWTGIMIMVFCVIIYYLVKLVAYLSTVVIDFFSNLFTYFQSLF